MTILTPTIPAQMIGSSIGSAGQTGNFVWDEANAEFKITGRGTITKQGKSDSFYFVQQKSNKNLIFSSQMHWEHYMDGTLARAGLMLREDLSPESRFVGIAQDNKNQTFVLYRKQNSTPTDEISLGTIDSATFWIEKIKNEVLIKVAEAGEPLKTIKIIDFPVDTFHFGLFVITSDAPQDVATASFFNTRVYYTAPENFVPYSDYIGSQLEVLDIATGRRKIIYSTNDPIEAPNWTPDGKAIIFNSRGLLYRLNLGTTQSQQIPTGFATSNNNDHGISPDGKWLAISHHDSQLPAGKNSIIYILPIEGGTPRQVTRQAPSYWHGWSPDGKWLVYTAMRNNRWNIFKIPVDGGEEIQLTDNEFLNDAPEFSPDGQYIWFNSNRSGKMQIWKMHADGLEQTQVTNDNLNNWFPHLSPNGQWVIFLSYLPEVNPWEHPYYKEVTLQLMKPDGTDKKIIAYLYGGQGTINVPSWSPDGQKIAFVSNSNIK